MDRSIDDLKDENYRLGDLAPGSINERWLTCGKEGCKCADGDKHGPYYYFVYTDYAGNQHQITLDNDDAAALQERIDAYVEFQAALLELVEREVDRLNSE